MAPQVRRRTMADVLPASDYITLPTKPDALSTQYAEHRFEIRLGLVYLFMSKSRSV
jgi:hypothetical protein